MRQKLKVRNQFEAWPGGTFCLFLLHHRECFVLLNPQVIKSGGEKELLARGRRSNYDAPIKAEQEFQLSREKVSIKPEKAEFHAVSRPHFYIQCLIFFALPSKLVYLHIFFLSIF